MTTVIRAGEAPNIRMRLGAVELSDHLDEARRLVEDARREAKRILDEAHAQAEQVHAETRESGYGVGYESGEREGREAGFAAARREASEEFEREHADLVSDMRRVVDEIDSIKADLQLAANERLLQFAVRLARRLTFDIGAADSRAATANLERALDVLGSTVDLTIRAHPQDVAALRTLAAGVTAHVARSRSVRMVEDAAMAPGGCVVSSEASEIDATLETQTAELAALLLGEAPATTDIQGANDTE